MFQNGGAAKEIALVALICFGQSYFFTIRGFWKSIILSLVKVV